MCRYMVVSRCFGLYDWKKQVINNVTNMWGRCSTSTLFLRVCTRAFQRWCFVVMFLTRLFIGGYGAIILQNDVAKRDFLKRTLKRKNVTFCKVVLMGNGG